jgi:hypothetical protein
VAESRVQWQRQRCDRKDAARSWKECELTTHAPPIDCRGTYLIVKVDIQLVSQVSTMLQFMLAPCVAPSKAFIKSSRLDSSESSHCQISLGGVNGEVNGGL